MTEPERNLARTFRALADPTRIRILQAIRSQERPVGELARSLGLPQPKVSGHLAVLRRSGLVTTRRAHRTIFYRPADDRVAALLDLGHGWEVASGAAPASRSRDHLVLRLAGDPYAVPIAQAREAIPYRRPHRLPSARTALLGVIDLRGDVIEVYDLALALGLEASERRLIVIVGDGSGRTAGLAVDGIDGITPIEQDSAGGITPTVYGPCLMLDADDLLPALAHDGHFAPWTGLGHRV